MIRNIILFVTIGLMIFFSFLLFNFNKNNTVMTVNDHTYITKSNLALKMTEPPSFLKTADDLMEKVKLIMENQYPKPIRWGESVNGVIQKIDTDEKVIALTFDACGGDFGSGYDKELINFLIDEGIPATLFINSRWIEANLEQFHYLASVDIFQIENHGTEHRPLSVNGGTAWGIQGTTSVEEVVTEVITNYKMIKELTGHEARYFRSGTAFYDDVAVQIVTDLGMKVVNYDILGDAGATFSASQVRNALLRANPGSIALLHMNQPSSGTAAGVKVAIPKLREQGFTFVTLEQGFKLE